MREMVLNLNKYFISSVRYNNIYDDDDDDDDHNNNNNNNNNKNNNNSNNCNIDNNDNNIDYDKAATIVIIIRGFSNITSYVITVS